jgi:hypothetical protein
LVPSVKVIAMVRNPVSRAYSQYQHNLRLGHEPLSFEEALEAEESRIEGEVHRLKAEPGYQARFLRRHGYAERGKYDTQLLPWLERFPADHIHIVRSEDFFASPEASFHEILHFLQLAPFQPTEFHNYSQPLQAAPAEPQPKVDSPKPSEHARTRLREILEPHVVGLEQLLGRDFGWL